MTATVLELKTLDATGKSVNVIFYLFVFVWFTNGVAYLREGAYERGHQWTSRRKNKGIEIKIAENNIKNG